MSHYDWTETTCREQAASAAYLEAAAEDGTVIRFHLEDRDGEVRPSFSVETGGQTYCTDDAEDWPIIEQYVPREEWPEPMYVGKRGPAERRPDTAVVEALDQYRAGLYDAAREETHAETVETVRAYMGEFADDLDDDQIDQLASAFEHASRDEDTKDESAAYCAAAVQYVVGDVTLEELRDAAATAQRALDEATQALRGGINAAHYGGVSDLELERRVGRFRSTIRRWRGE